MVLLGGVGGVNVKAQLRLPNRLELWKRWNSIFGLESAGGYGGAKA